MVEERDVFSTQGAARFPTIDADAHVIETERTWAYMDASDDQFRPALRAPSQADGRPRWMVDGQQRGFGAPTRPAGQMEQRQRVSGRTIVAPEESAQMVNIETRLQHMDEVGVDIQVLHTSFFIRPVTERPEGRAGPCPCS